MADFKRDLLDRPAVLATSTVALTYLDDAVAAAARLGDRTETEALHDFRVAIRRLRVAVRAYPGLHESVPRKQRRRLRKLARATNPGRDAEVQLAWFSDRSQRFTPAERRALGPLRARLRRRRRRAIADARGDLQDRFEKLERKLRRRLTALRSDAGSHEAPFRAVAAATVVQHATDLARRLNDVSSSADPAALHATRIAAKRLRYLLEPVESGLSNGTALGQHLKNLQDLFGALTDAHELELVLREAGEIAAPAASLLRTEVAALLSTLRDDWSEAGPDLERRIGAVARQLQPAKQRPRPQARRRRLRRAVVGDFSGS
ncbi:MAG: CHAD domain-containing protein [Gemmatimonadales bacterium]